MWARNALFLGICLIGTLAIADSLLRRNRIERPASGNATPAAAEGGANELDTLESVNAEFRQSWEARGLSASPRADDLTIARRMSLALVGTVPSLEEIRALEAMPAEQRIAWWTDYLLEDRRFSDYWAERLARTYVGNDKGPFLVFRRRRFTMWLSDELSKNTPYDELVRKLIAEEGIWTGKPATNFITASADPNNDNQPDEIRLAGRTARAFLGMRIDCLQCHDDKLGTINLGSPEKIHSGTQADFHQLAAFFGPTEIRLVGVRDGKSPYRYKYLEADKETVVPAKTPFLDDLADGHGTRREQLARWVTHPNNKPFARATVNRVWALLFGRPLLTPIDDIPLVAKYPPGMQRLADDFVAHGYDLKWLIRMIVASDAFQRDSLAEFEITPEHEDHWAVFPLTRLRPEQMAGSLVQSSQLSTINGDAHVLLQIAKFAQTGEFVERYGDIGEDEFTSRAGTIPQRLLMMNGKLVKERTGDNFFNAAAIRIAALSRQPEKQVEAAYLATLTRRPTDPELSHFINRLTQRDETSRAQAMEDLYWTLINSTEFSWNH